MHKKPLDIGIDIWGSWQGLLSVPAFSYVKNLGEVTFTDESSIFPTSWLWDFGDGETSTEQNPVHVYAREGTFYVVLTVTNFAGSSFCSPVPITIDIIPDAAFSVSVNGLNVAFVDESSSAASEWAWDFGDGNTSTEQNPTHDYVAGGEYTVQLVVSNANGDSNAVQNTIHVLVADFTYEASGLSVDFTDTSVGSPDSWLWDFGDGGTSTEQNPTHVYSAGATFTVQLTVSYGVDEAQTSQDIIVAGTVEYAVNFDTEDIPSWITPASGLVLDTWDDGSRVLKGVDAYTTYSSNIPVLTDVSSYIIEFVLSDSQYTDYILTLVSGDYKVDIYRSGVKLRLQSDGSDVAGWPSDAGVNQYSNNSANWFGTKTIQKIKILVNEGGYIAIKWWFPNKTEPPCWAFISPHLTGSVSGSVSFSTHDFAPIFSIRAVTHSTEGWHDLPKLYNVNFTYGEPAPALNYRLENSYGDAPYSPAGVTPDNVYRQDTSADGAYLNDTIYIVPLFGAKDIRFYGKFKANIPYSMTMTLRGGGFPKKESDYTHPVSSFWMVWDMSDNHKQLRLTKADDDTQGFQIDTYIGDHPVADQIYYLRIELIGSTYRYKLWNEGSAEPSWEIVYNNTDPACDQWRGLYAAFFNGVKWSGQYMEIHEMTLEILDDWGADPVLVGE